MNLDTALRLFLDTFRLLGESQKIHRVLEAFSERYYEQSPQILANKDVALLLSYSLIMLNTHQYNVQPDNCFHFSACHHLEDVLDDLVVSLCKFTALLNPSSAKEPVLGWILLSEMNVQFAMGCMGLKNAKPSRMKPKSKISAEDYSMWRTCGISRWMGGHNSNTYSQKFPSSKKPRQQLLLKIARLRKLTCK
ncbi:ARF guanine-nucleotide exchange factor GNOM [Tanacetum coccineum]